LIVGEGRLLIVSGEIDRTTHEIKIESAASFASSSPQNETVCRIIEISVDIRDTVIELDLVTDT